MEQTLSEQEIQKRIELMKQNCIFCKIIKKEISSHIIFEDDLCMAILDINPATKGHMLLFPKEHYMMFPMVPDEILSHISIISKHLCDLLMASFNPIDVTIFIANGKAAGQLTQHFMMHIIPRYENDGINFDIDSKEHLNIAELEDLAKKMKEKLSNV